MGYWPYITIGGKYKSNIVIVGDLKELPFSARDVLRRFFNRWNSLSDPASFPDLLKELRGLHPPIEVKREAVDRYNKYIETHTVVFFGASSSNETSSRISARKKGERITPRLGAIISAFCNPDATLRDPVRVWEMGDWITNSDGLIEYDKSFSDPFALLANKTVAFEPSRFFLYQVEVCHHPKILAPEIVEILEPHVERWAYRTRDGRNSARWLFKDLALFPGVLEELFDRGLNVHLALGAWGNVARAHLIAGREPQSPPVELKAPVDVKGGSALPVDSLSFEPVSDDALGATTSAVLYPFQRVGVRHLVYTGRAMLADDMGLGKSVQAIAALKLLHVREGLRRALIICPASMKYQWKMEIEKFTELSPVIIEGDREARRAVYERASKPRTKLEGLTPEVRPEIFIVNYELSFRDNRELLDLKPDAIILDEAQRIKNWQSKTHQSIVKMPARFRFVLTGTPLENELMELYSVMQFVNPDVLGKKALDMKKRYTVPDKFGGIKGYQNLREASRRLSGVSLRRTREETLPELPELVESLYWLDLEPDQRRIYKDIEERAAGFLSLKEWDKVAHDSVLTTVQRLREVCDTPEILFPEHRGGAKLSELFVLLDEQVKQMGRQAIVFTQWTRMAEILCRELTRLGFKFRYMHGGLNSKERAKIIDEFNRGEAEIFVSTDAGSAGLNLQAASIVVNFDLPFNPAIVDQRVARAHRMGQKSSVNAWHFVCRGTIEENLVRILDKRRKLFRDVFSEVSGGVSPDYSPRGQMFLRELLGR